ncbi:hypothetical protein DRW41_02345 [Neobacillus piezotolerans]|uniref:DUF1885 family protein n=1 Tax=Neobacillus piezotolerans TaxID=2259171 RepID=A0A3D8GVB8_9BACI|nr:DUF1885 family protein [Neobacillus piezotolerans]RDU38424.1 hypothetical protein DRW41_02345 [Neobacillus piezotolerans]
MAENAFIKLVPSSAKQSVTLDELKKLFTYYKEITSKTGTQVGWNYDESAFPYEIKETPEGKGDWFYLNSTDPDRYRAIAVAVGKEAVETDEGTPAIQPYVQITLPDGATAGDKGKANEFCKFLAKKFQAELHLFNGRIMYYNPRK